MRINTFSLDFSNVNSKKLSTYDVHVFIKNTLQLDNQEIISIGISDTRAYVKVGSFDILEYIFQTYENNLHYIDDDGKKYEVILLNESQKNVVKISGIPIEVPDSAIHKCLSAYGKVGEIKNGKWKNLPFDCYNETKLINMEITKPIPPQVSIQEKMYWVSSTGQVKKYRKHQLEKVTNNAKNETDLQEQKENENSLESTSDILTRNGKKQDVRTDLFPNFKLLSTETEMLESVAITDVVNDILQTNKKEENLTQDNQDNNLTTNNEYIEVVVKMVEDKKKYNYLENTLIKINQKYISISKDDDLRNNEVLGALLKVMTDKMKEKDNLFKEMYTRVFYGGSYYDGLRVGQPNEFDLDLLLNLPKLVEPEISTSNIPGFVEVKFNGMANFYKQTDLVVRYKGLDKLLKDSYLDTAQTLQWMEKVVTLTLNDFTCQDSWYSLKTPIAVFQAKIRKGGPAFTLQVKGNYKSKDILIDIDLVPCFIFGDNKWPKNGFKANPVKKDKPDFFIVPKPLKSQVAHSSRYWRLSFQEQERVLMDRKKALKPAIKLLKKLRDKYDHKCIASYYLKTVILQQIDNHDDAFWQNSQSYVFMAMLKEYYNYLTKSKIPYYWNKNYNLIGGVKPVTIENIANKIKAILADLDKNQDPQTIAKHLLTQTELDNLFT